MLENLLVINTTINFVEHFLCIDTKQDFFKIALGCRSHAARNKSLYDKSIKKYEKPEKYRERQGYTLQELH